MTNRFLCWLLGHEPEDVTQGVEECKRCGEVVSYYLDGSQWTDRERYGFIDPLRRLWQRFSRWTWPRCWHCGKRLAFRRYRLDRDFCCQKCCDEWVPF